MNAPMVGDEVLVRGTVTRVERGVGVVVELFSKTDQYEAWVRRDLIVDVVLPDVPGEPPDGTWLAGQDPDAGHERVFIRNDAEGHNDREVRRHDRRWWDVYAEQWIDWPTAVRRGADPNRVLREVKA